jgi:tripartite-type tricarboxylate transporter receptor subunit TctC
MRYLYRFFVSLGLAGNLLAIAAPSIAQASATESAAWPTRPIKLVVPTQPGQASDVLARLLADSLAKSLGTAVVVENRGGAGGSIGLASVAKAAPDGYTLAIGSSGPLTISPAYYPKLPFDSVKDFEPIANIALTPQVILVSANGPYKTLADLITAARQKDLPFAIASMGSTTHFAYAAFKRAAKVNFNMVPFSGNVQAASRVIAGDVAAMYDTVPGALGFVRTGKLRPIAIAAPRRSPYFPDTPTLAEQGITGAESIGWIGLVAPAGTPAFILDKLNAQVKLFLASSEAKKSLEALAFVPVEDASRAAFANTIHSELAHWSKLAKEVNIHAQ